MRKQTIILCMAAAAIIGTACQKHDGERTLTGGG